MICEKRGWTLQKFYDLPLGEQEELLAFFQASMAKKNYDNLKEQQAIESSKNAGKKDDTKEFVDKIRQRKEDRNKRKKIKTNNKKEGE